MKQLRSLVPILGAIALIALFLMMPEIPSLGCKACSSNDPYTPLIGAGYFSTLIALSLIFPSFPGRYIARGGLTWSVLLALVLTYIHLPLWCPLCLVGHACNILIWTVWLMVSSEKREKSALNAKERLFLLLLAPFSVVALFSCLNLTFMAYGFKISHAVSSTGLQLGEEIPIFSTKTIEGRSITNAEAGGIVINFVSSSCLYCKEQLEVINAAAEQLSGSSYRFINVISVLPPEMVRDSPATEWVEDKEGNLRKLFKVSGYPTMFVVGDNGKIEQVIAGVPQQLKNYLTSILIRSKNE